MALILGGIAAAAIAAQALWRRFTQENPTQALMTSRKVKVSTNLIVVLAQAVGYAAELLGGTRTTTPSTSSTTPAADPDRPKFGVPAGKHHAVEATT